MAHLWPAEHNFDIRPQGFEQAHDLCGLHHVPDIDAQADHTRLQRQQFLHNLYGRLLNDELAQLRLRPQARAAMHVHVSQQVAQAQRGVDVLGVQGGQNDGGGDGGRVDNLRQNHLAIIKR